LIWNGGEWRLDGLDALPHGREQIADVTALHAYARDEVVLVASWRRPGTVSPSDTTWLVVHDGRGITRQRPTTWDATLGVHRTSDGDVLAVDARGGVHVWRPDGSFTTLTAPSVAGVSKVAIVSATEMWALAEAGLAHFDGTAWTVEALPSDMPYPQAVVAPAAGDVWLAGPQWIAHREGATWRRVAVEALRAPVYLAADGPSRVWATSDERVLWSMRDGVETTTVLESAEDPIYRGGPAFGSLDDLWVFGAHLESSILPSPYHWDGATLVPAPGPRRPVALLEIDGRAHLVAGAFPSPTVWVRGVDRWELRPDLDATTLIPRPPTPSFLPGARTSSASETSFAAAASSIVRRGPAE
jgi:hypothetical protein